MCDALAVIDTILSSVSENADRLTFHLGSPIATKCLGAVAKIKKTLWPKSLPDQIAAVRQALENMGKATLEEVARRFVRARTATIAPLLESLAALGEDGRFTVELPRWVVYNVVLAWSFRL
ncbi:MAG: hypothetical protein ABJF50_15835 [Paracoccaceae bacterium]